jgi:hypothetical protein
LATQFTIILRVEKDEEEGVENMFPIVLRHKIVVKNLDCLYDLKKLEKMNICLQCTRIFYYGLSLI